MIDEEAGLDPYKPTKVDREPRFDSRELQANLVYPNELRENGKNGYIGHVEALVLVSKEGSVKKILVETPDDRRFNVAALNALKLLAFSPAEIGATPVPYWASIILVFRMR
jgi:outer membrane biosynthesis protein TonB